ncbi:MAG: hypothetical protein WAQ24_03020 [Candidatus Saccharimonadales bacterium]
MTLPFTDHHIQDKIIAKLVVGEQRFSGLVPTGMEHSLLMYHLRKLLKQGIVEKDDQTYRLTLKGAQLYNTRFHLAKPLNYPKALIQFLVIQEDKVLLSRRTTAIAEQLNEYMLPGGLHFFLAPSRTSAKHIAKSRGLVAGDYLCMVETIAPESEYHGLIDVYAASPSELRAGSEYEAVWLPVNEVAAMSFDQAGSAPFIVQHFTENTLTNRLTNIVQTTPKTGGVGVESVSQ